MECQKDKEFEEILPLLLPKNDTLYYEDIVVLDKKNK